MRTGRKMLRGGEREKKSNEIKKIGRIRDGEEKLSKGHGCF